MEIINEIKSFDNKFIDISNLSVAELWLLHYEQEKAFAGLIRQTKPFSVERAEIMHSGYKAINAIMLKRGYLEGNIIESYGSHDSYILFLKKIIKKSKKKSCIFFEAGVGTGKIIRAIAEIPNLNVMGCDIYIDKKFFNDQLNVTEGTIYENLLKLEDDTIDIFYWNDVIEHIPEDEIEEHIRLLAKKMAPKGLIITITPNRLNGPHDITRHYEPRGIAKGFHFYEYTFKEVLGLFKKYEIRSGYCILGFLKKGLYMIGPKWLDKIKIVLEKTAACLPYSIKRILLGLGGCSISILKK